MSVDAAHWFKHGVTIAVTPAKTGAAARARTVWIWCASGAVRTLVAGLAAVRTWPFEEDRCAVALSVFSAADIGVAVGSADWVGDETVELTRGPALPLLANVAASAVGVASALGPTLALVPDRDTSTTRFAGIAVGLAVDAADRVEDVGTVATLAEAGATAR